MASGNLPNLAALARSGTLLPVDASALAGLAYPTLYGGVGPAQHGQYYPLQWHAGLQRVVVATAFPYPETIFARMDRAGKRVVVLDPPELQKPVLRNGYAVSGLQFRARVLLHAWSTSPAVTAGLLRPIGPPPRADEVFGAIVPSDMRHMRNALLPAPARLESAALSVLRRDPPDCLWLNCCALHLAAHQFSHLPAIADPALRAVLEGTRLDLARRYDRTLGEVLTALPPGARVLITYAKGMGRVPLWAQLLPRMLRRILGEREARPPLHSLRVALPRPVRRWLADRLPDNAALRMMATLSTPRLNWSRTRAFCLPTDYPGFLRFNLQGRERRGIVKSGELHEIEQRIRDGLATFTDECGHPCVDRISRPEELFGPGSRLDQFPDLIVHWRHDSPAPRTGVRSPRFGEIPRTAETVGRSGNHIPGAFSILSGGRRTLSKGTMQVEDISRTILHGAGVPADDLPGRSFWEE